MTVFYRFDDAAAFAAAGGKPLAEYIEGDAAVSVIGDYYLPDPDPLPEDYEPVHDGYLVNSSRLVPAWADYRLPEDPSNPMRIYG